VSQDEKPTCGSGQAQGAYNTPLHIAALVVILVLSTSACGFPLIVKRFPRLLIPHHFLFLSRHFGTGVLIATAFVHLLPTAFVSLTDPCLPPFWNEDYPAMPGLIAMLAMFIVVGIEMFFAARGAGHVHVSDYDAFVVEDQRGQTRPADSSAVLRRRSSSFKRFQPTTLGVQEESSVSISLADVSRPSETPRQARDAEVSTPTITPPPPLPCIQHQRNEQPPSDDDSDLDDPQLSTSGLLNGKRNTSPPSEDDNATQPSSQSASPALHSHDHHHHHAPQLTPHQLHQKLLLQCLLLEAGILFHSVFIGMALSVSVGPPFLVLLIAISFHQTFEGLALGARISALYFPPSSPKPWLMALAYGTTTPVGQAIGLGVHKIYDPASQTGLLTVGVMNAISSGPEAAGGLCERGRGRGADVACGGLGLAAVMKRVGLRLVCEERGSGGNWIGAQVDGGVRISSIVHIFGVCFSFCSKGFRLEVCTF